MGQLSTSTIKMTGAQTISLIESDGVMSISVQPDSTGGSFTVLGSSPFQGIPSSPITLGTGQGFSIVADNPTSPITELTITWVSGIVNVLISYS